MGHETVKCSDQRFWRRISAGPDAIDRHVDLHRPQRIRWLAWIIRSADRHPEIDRTDDEDADTITLCFRKEYTVVLKPSQRGLSVQTAYSVRLLDRPPYSARSTPASVIQPIPTSAASQTAESSSTNPVRVADAAPLCGRNRPIVAGAMVAVP